jgi:hypothetical protein
VKKVKPNPKTKPLKQKRSWKKDPLNDKKVYTDRQIVYFREHQDKGAEIAKKWL